MVINFTDLNNEPIVSKIFIAEDTSILNKYNILNSVLDIDGVVINDKNDNLKISLKNSIIDCILFVNNSIKEYIPTSIKLISLIDKFQKPGYDGVMLYINYKRNIYLYEYTDIDFIF